MLKFAKQSNIGKKERILEIQAQMLQKITGAIEEAKQKLVEVKNG